MEFGVLVFIGIINLVLCFAIAGLWERKGHSYGGGWWLSFFLSPLVGFIVGMCLDDVSKKSQV